MNQPTLADVPGILTRTILRLVARVFLGVAGAIFLLSVALGVFSLLLVSFRSARTTRTQAIAQLIEAVIAIFRESRGR